MSNITPQDRESQPHQPIPWKLIFSATAFLPFAVFFGYRGDTLGHRITVIGAAAILCYAVYALRPR